MAKTRTGKQKRGLRLCACGCKEYVSHSKQTRHLQAKGPLHIAVNALTNQVNQLRRAGGSGDRMIIDESQDERIGLTPAPLTDLPGSPMQESAEPVILEPASPSLSSSDSNDDGARSSDERAMGWEDGDIGPAEDTDSLGDDARAEQVIYEICHDGSQLPDRLPAQERLREAFEREVHGIDGTNLAEDDQELLRAFALKVQDFLSEATFDKFQRTFRSSRNLGSARQARRRIEFLSGLEPVRYDCCINSCVSYANPAYASLTRCPKPKCEEPRYTADGKPRKVHVHIPLIPRLQAFQGNRAKAAKMQYRAKEHVHIPGKTTDIFDSERYRKLRMTRISVHGEELGVCFFPDERDIALGLSTDGFSPFRGPK
ncbi:hypothetical protein OH76DRAFT_1387642, partial [Lentinus brumalis]